MPLDACHSHAGMIITEAEKISFCSEFYRRDWPNELCVYELVCSFGFILKHAIVMNCYFCSLAAIAYVLIFDIGYAMACQVSSES